MIRFITVPTKWSDKIAHNVDRNNGSNGQIPAKMRVSQPNSRQQERWRNYVYNEWMHLDSRERNYIYNICIHALSIEYRIQIDISHYQSPKASTWASRKSAAKQAFLDWSMGRMQPSPALHAPPPCTRYSFQPIDLHQTSALHVQLQSKEAPSRLLTFTRPSNASTQKGLPIYQFNGREGGSPSHQGSISACYSSTFLC